MRAIGRMQIGINTLGQSRLEINGNEDVLHSTQTPRLNRHHHMQFNVITRTLNDVKYCSPTLIILFNIIYSFIQLNGFKYCYLILMIIFNINQLFTHSLMVSSIVNDLTGP